MCLLSSLGRIDFGTKIMTLVECLHQIFQITSKKKIYGQGESIFEKKIYLMNEKKNSTKYVDCLLGVSQAAQYRPPFHFFSLLFYLFTFDNERLLSNFETKTIFVSHFCNFNESL